MHHFIKITFIIILISGFGSPTVMATGNKQIEKEVLSAFNGLVKASEDLNTDAYFSFFDQEKFSGLNADGKVWRSFNEFKPLIASGFPMIEKSLSLEFPIVKVTVINASTAILVNQYKHIIQLKNGAAIKQAGGGTQVWSKNNATWKLVSVSASNTK